MTVNLPAAAQALYDQGWFGDAYLIRIDLPGKTVGYVRGPRSLEFNGLVYIPNRYLSPIGGVSELGYADSSRTVTFANVPTENADDAVASIEDYDYQNAPCTITTLATDPETGEIAGAVETAFFEVAFAEHQQRPAGKDGKRELNLTIGLDAPGRAIREQTAATSGQEEHQFDNDPNDTSSRFLGTVGEWVIEWGRV